MKCCQSPTVTGWKEAARSRLSVWEASLQAVSESNQKGFMSAERNVSLSKAAKINSAGVFLHLKLKHLAQVKLTIKKEGHRSFQFPCSDVRKKLRTVRTEATVTKSDRRESNHGGIIQCGMTRRAVTRHYSGGRHSTTDRWQMESIHYCIPTDPTGHGTQNSQTHIQDSLDKMQKGQAVRHAWVIIIIKKKNQSINESNTSQIRRWLKRASDWKLEKLWVSVQRRGQTPEKSRQWTFWVPLQVQRDESSPWHQPNTLAHTHTHATHTHAQRSVRVGYMSDPNTQVHDVQLTSDSQLIGQIKKRWIKKRSKTKIKDHNSASIKWPLSRSTYQHFLGCWLIDKCCQSHTENKTKQKL